MTSYGPKRRDTASFKEKLTEWIALLDLRYDASTHDALDFCATEEDAEWLRRVRANLPASMGSRDVIYEKRMEKSLKRKAIEEDREKKRAARVEKEKQVKTIVEKNAGIKWQRRVW